jgi:hypothetical protein
MMNPLSVQTKNEVKRRQENAEKARALSDELFPGEIWQIVEEGIYISSRRKRGGDTNYLDELRDSQILRDVGCTVYLVPELRHTPGRKYDAIVNGMKVEFKNVGGNKNTLITHFFHSREQAPNVFINLETSDLTRGEVMDALYGARNTKAHLNKKGVMIRGYDEHNAFSGGQIILKLKEQDNLVYLNVDDLAIS